MANENPSPQPDDGPSPAPAAKPEPTSVWGRRFPFFYGIYLFVRARIVQGILVVLPIAVTFWILHWLYRVSRDYVIDPIAYLVTRYLLGQEVYRTVPRGGGGVAAGPTVPGSGPPTGEAALTAGQSAAVVTDSGLPPWMENFIAPLIAVAIVLAVLYFLGMFFQSRLHKAVDWILLRVPIVTTIYSAMRKLVESLQSTQGGDMTKRFKRIVLVEFPHPGIRVPAFVTSSCVDVLTRKTILCVYVPTTPLPTAGYLLMVPEEEVVDIDWDVNETLAAIISGGITVPKEIGYWNAAEIAEQRRHASEAAVVEKLAQPSPLPEMPE